MTGFKSTKSSNWSKVAIFAAADVYMGSMVRGSAFCSERPSRLRQDGRRPTEFGGDAEVEVDEVG